MPKKDVDYSNTIIYKICCKDESITDVYVGHTTNFIQRKYAHKIASNNLNNALKIYNVIRLNGGWENWDMVEIAKYSCKDSIEARIKEQEHYNNMKACLNSCPPYVDIKKYSCNICNLQCKGPKQYNDHMNCIKHINNFTNKEIDLSTIIPKNYCCELCNYNTSYSKDYKKHLQTKKHIEHNGTIEEITKVLFCKNCEKEFKTNAGLWKHKQKCNVKEYAIKDEPTDKDLIMLLIKENSELKNLVIKVLEVITCDDDKNEKILKNISNVTVIND